MADKIWHINDGDPDLEFSSGFLDFLRKKYPERTARSLAEQYLDSACVKRLEEHGILKD